MWVIMEVIKQVCVGDKTKPASVELLLHKQLVSSHRDVGAAGRSAKQLLEALIT